MAARLRGSACTARICSLQTPSAPGLPLIGFQQSHPAVDLVALERDKIRGAVRTDFILSAEIIVIALGTVQGSSLGLQIAVVAGIALLMTVGVYGLVGLIVKLDDIGLHLLQKPDGDPAHEAPWPGVPAHGLRWAV